MRRPSGLDTYIHPTSPSITGTFHLRTLMPSHPSIGGFPILGGRQDSYFSRLTSLLAQRRDYDRAQCDVGWAERHLDILEEKKPASSGTSRS